jgi:hypothetical protein
MCGGLGAYVRDFETKPCLVSTFNSRSPNFCFQKNLKMHFQDFVPQASTHPGAHPLHRLETLDRSPRTILLQRRSCLIFCTATSRTFASWTSCAPLPPPLRAAPHAARRYNLEKTHFIVDEMICNGFISETNRCLHCREHTGPPSNAQHEALCGADVRWEGPTSWSR